ncbi:MAG: (d)CMP kinase [Candidatus Omnitrophica bacterium]|nr:(d)CMP kinase [Candidatus Omnitrophota bacterium]
MARAPAKTRRFVITIDGPSGSGKSTAARKLAQKLGFLYLDTGAMYRAVALQAKEKGISWENGPALARLAARTRIEFKKAAAGKVRVFADGKEVTRSIRRPEISSGASRVAAFPGVRRALVRQQRVLGRSGNVVAEGRDTGTVVFPKAPLKFFLTAAASERARRRREELKEAGHRASFRRVLREVRQRDRRDRHRRIAPLRPAPGAIRIDNTKLQSNQVLGKLLAYVRGV